MPWDGSQLPQQHHQSELSPTPSTLVQASHNQTDGGTSGYVRFLPLWFFPVVSPLGSTHVAKCDQDDYSFALKIILCIVSHWAVGAHDLVKVESPIAWPAGEALTGALGALNPEFNGDLSDHFGSDSAKRVFTVLLLSLAVALCFSLPGCLPSVLRQASGLPLLRGHPGTPVSLATHACARVQSECLVPGILVALTQDSPVLLSRALWSKEIS